MKSILKCLSAAVLLAPVVAGAAHAATLSDVKGEVLLNQGAGYQPSTGSANLKATDSVLANPGGSAIVTCDNGTVLRVSPGTVVMVSDCDVAGAAALGTGATAPNYLLLGGLAVAGGVGLIVAVSSGSDKAASP